MSCQEDMEMSNLGSPSSRLNLHSHEGTHALAGGVLQQRFPPNHSDDGVLPTTATSLNECQTNDASKSTDTLLQDLTSKSLKPGRRFVKKFNDPEPPKEVCSNSIWSALRHLALFHLPAVAITLTLFSLHVARVHWGDLTSEQLNAMQFAAKGHEILILLSLTDVLMYQICYGLLLDSEGVSLGFLSSPFHLGSPVEYLFSWELWATILQSGESRMQHRPKAIGMVIILAILLSLAAAPLSAIAMIPRSGWWQIPGPPVAKGKGEYIKVNLYETNLGQDQIEMYTTANRTDLYGEDDTGEPLELTLKTLIQTITNPPVTIYESTTRQMVNITYSNYPKASLSRPITITEDLRLVYGEFALATCPMYSVSNGFGGRYDQQWGEMPPNLLTKSEWKKLDSPTPKRWKQPVVVVGCASGHWYPETVDSVSFLFYSKLSDGKTVLRVENDAGLKKLVEIARANRTGLSKMPYHISNLPNDTSSTISTDILILGDTPKYDSNGRLIKGHVDEHINLYLCLIHARWVEADVWVDNSKSDVAWSHFNPSLFDFYDNFGNSSKADDLIKMDRDWMVAMGNHTGQYTDNSGKKATSPRTKSSYQHMVEFCMELSDADDDMENCLQITLAAHMADILSWPGESYYYDDISEVSSSDTIFHNTYFVGGYGYDILSSLTIPFALSVLLLHVAVVIAHVVSVLWIWRGWHASSWRSFGQILTLALRSRGSDELGSVGGGVASSQTWNTSASVRVVNDQGRLELVLRKKNREGHNDQDSDDQGVEDRSETEGVSTGFMRVHPGMKYL